MDNLGQGDEDFLDNRTLPLTVDDACLERCQGQHQDVSRPYFVPELSSLYVRALSGEMIMTFSCQGSPSHEIDVVAAYEVPGGEIVFADGYFWLEPFFRMKGIIQ